MSRERVYVVDENDSIIGEKWRDELTDNDCWRVISVWVTDKDANVLIQQRSLRKKLGPGIWSAACEGTIELGDLPEKTAVRELTEEIGITTTEDSLVGTTKIHYKDPFLGWRVKYGYKLVIDHVAEADFILQEEEVEAVRWVDHTELDSLRRRQSALFPLYDQYVRLGFID